VAVLAVSAPITSPRRAWNQRDTTAAPRTVAAMPEPTPTSSPHRTTSCQAWRIPVARKSAAARIPIASAIVRRIPIRSVSAAVNGPIRP
jgi:hypothetical protein